MKEIYLIVWVGRDYESGVWGEYPSLEFGYFTDKDRAQGKADELNNETPREYDADAEDIETYVVQSVHKA